MSDLGIIMVSCSGPQEIVGAVNKVNSALPLELRRRLNQVFSNYLAGYGLRGVYERMNNRTVSQILTDFQPANLKVLASGEVDGVRYRLCDAPPSRLPEKEKGEKEKGT